MSDARGYGFDDGEVRVMDIIHVFASEYCRLVADALKEGIAELRKDEEKRVSQYVHGGVFMGEGR